MIVSQVMYMWMDMRRWRVLHNMNIDMEPHFLGLLPANPGTLEISTSQPAIKGGDVLTINGKVAFDKPNDPAIAKLGQVVHVEVFDPTGKLMKWYTKNHLFSGDKFAVSLPISYSEPPGRYTVVIEHAVTGAKATTSFDVTEGRSAK